MMFAPISGAAACNTNYDSIVVWTCNGCKKEWHAEGDIPRNKYGEKVCDGCQSGDIEKMRYNTPNDEPSKEDWDEAIEKSFARNKGFLKEMSKY